MAKIRCQQGLSQILLVMQQDLLEFDKFRFVSFLGVFNKIVFSIVMYEIQDQFTLFALSIVFRTFTELFRAKKYGKLW